MRKNRLTLYSCILLLLGGLLMPSKLQAQIFSEDFNSPGGAFPTGWTLINQDGLTPATNVGYVTDAWVVRDDFIVQGDTCAFSTSWYTPAGTANDWMITPPIALGNANYIVSWEANAPDANYPDGYEVRIGLSPTIAGQSTILYTTPAELSVWTSRQAVIPASFNNQTVYISWRNNSNDDFLLLIDSIRVDGGIQYDAEMTSVGLLNPEYTRIPFSESPALDLSGTITNVGTDPISNVNMTVNVYDGSLSLVNTVSGTAVSSLAAGSNSVFSLGTWTPTAPDLYTFEYFSTITQSDGDTSNDTLVQIFEVDSTYARDVNVLDGTLGIGPGTPGQLGLIYDLNSINAISSVTFAIGNQGGQMTNQWIQAEVRDWNSAAGTPGNLLALTDSVQIDTSVNTLWTLPVLGGPLFLAQDTFYVGVIEGDSNVTLGTSNNIFTPGTGWVDFPTNPVGPWANNEDFNFNVTYILRPNFRIDCQLAVDSMSSTNESSAGANDGTATVFASGGIGGLTYSWSTTPPQTTSTATGLGAGTYIVTVTDSVGCTATDSVTVGVSASLSDIALTQTTLLHPEFTRIPFSENPVLNLGGQIENVGNTTVNNVNLTINVYDGSQTLVNTVSGTPVASLTSGNNTSFSLGTWSPTVADGYTFEYVASMTQADANPGNDSASVPFDADSTYARDDNTPTGTIGIGVGTPGDLGVIYPLNNLNAISSVSFVIGNQGGSMTNQFVSAEIREWDSGNQRPGNVVAVTDSVQIDTSQFALWTVPVQGGPYFPTMDTFYVGVLEGDSNVTLANCDNIFIAGTNWADFPNNPFGGFVPAEAFGSGFARAMMVRPNFRIDCTVAIDSITSSDESCVGCGDGTATVSPMGGLPPYTYSWNTSPVQTTQTATGLSTGFYTVVVTDSAGCSTTDSVFVDVFVNIDDPTLQGIQAHLAPNPNQGTFELTVELSALNDLEVKVVDLVGKQVFLDRRTGVKTYEEKISIPELAAGTYFLRIATQDEVRTLKMVVK